RTSQPPVQAGGLAFMDWEFDALVSRFALGKRQRGSDVMADRNDFKDRNGAAFRPAAQPADPFDRQLPQSVEAERAVLGSILLLPEVFDEVALVVRANDFYDEANRQLYETLLAMHDG